MCSLADGRMARRATFLGTATQLMSATNRRGLGIVRPQDASGTMGRDLVTESAVLLYQMVMEKGNRGETFGEEANGATAGDTDVQVIWTTGDNETGHVVRDGADQHRERE